MPVIINYIGHSLVGHNFDDMGYSNIGRLGMKRFDKQEIISSSRCKEGSGNCKIEYILMLYELLYII